MPTRTTNALTMDRAYSDALDAFKRGEKQYWPNTWNRSNEPDQVILTWVGHDAATTFILRLSEHRTVLVEAKEKLRVLLKSNFSDDALLYQTNTHPYR